MDDKYRENWEDLANAVVEQAAKDYLKALKMLKGWSRAVLHGKTVSYSQRNRMQSHMRNVYECETFFEKYASNWTGIDGEYLRDKLIEASGMNREILNALIKQYQKEDQANERETRTSISESGGTEDVRRPDYTGTVGYPGRDTAEGGHGWSAG